jgi:hypothetical protein
MTLKPVELEVSRDEEVVLEVDAVYSEGSVFSAMRRSTAFLISLALLFGVIVQACFEPPPITTTVYRNTIVPSSREVVIDTELDYLTVGNEQVSLAIELANQTNGSGALRLFLTLFGEGEEQTRKFELPLTKVDLSKPVLLFKSHVANFSKATAQIAIRSAPAVNFSIIWAYGNADSLRSRVRCRGAAFLALLPMFHKYVRAICKDGFGRMVVIQKLTFGLVVVGLVLTSPFMVVVAPEYSLLSRMLRSALASIASAVITLYSFALFIPFVDLSSISAVSMVIPSLLAVSAGVNGIRLALQPKWQPLMQVFPSVGLETPASGVAIVFWVVDAALFAVYAMAVKAQVVQSKEKRWEFYLTVHTAGFVGVCAFYAIHWIGWAGALATFAKTAPLVAFTFYVNVMAFSHFEAQAMPLVLHRANAEELEANALGVDTIDTIE